MQVKNISVPPSARASSDYHVAIRSLDSIVTAQFPHKIRIIEGMKFEFDFLSTILLVWKTETSRQAEEAAKKAEEVKRMKEENKMEEMKRMEELKRMEEARRMMEKRRAEENRRVEEIRRSEEAARVSNTRARRIRETPVAYLDEDVDDPVAPKLLALPAPAAPNRPTFPPPSRYITSSRPPNYTTPPSKPNPPTPPPQLALPAPPRIATPQDPMPVDPSAASEGPIRTKCELCPDKTSENIEELLLHHSFMHFREEIEKAYVTDFEECGQCRQKFSLKFNLIKHIGFVHGAVSMDIAATERWICNDCQKEFLSDEFLKKHWIKVHLEREFENRYFVLSESDEMMCQFCDKTFTFKRNLFVHIGLEHGKLVEVAPDYNKADPKEQLLHCNHCDFGGEMGEFKTHLATTHYRQSLLAVCLEEQILQAGSLACSYCSKEFDTQELLVSHLGTRHNRVLRYISHFQSKNVKMMFNPRLEGFGKEAGGQEDPLGDPLGVMDMEVLLEESGQEGDTVKLVSPTKLLAKKTREVTRAVVRQPRAIPLAKKPAETAEARKQESWSTSTAKNTAETPGSRRQEIRASNGSSKDLSEQRDSKDFLKPLDKKIVKIENPLLTQFRVFMEERGHGPQDAVETLNQSFETFLDTKVKEEQLEEVVTALMEHWPGVSSSQGVRRRRMLRDYKTHCSSLGCPPPSLPAMQTVIFLSQQLGREGAGAQDLQWLLRRAGRLGSGPPEPLVVQFFQSVGHTLEVPVEVKEQDKQTEQKVHREEMEEQEVEATEEETAQLVTEFKSLRLRLGLSQKACVAEVRAAGEQWSSIQTVDLAKFELRHSGRAVRRFLAPARAWLERRGEKKKNEVLGRLDVESGRAAKRKSTGFEGQQEKKILKQEPREGAIAVQGSSRIPMVKLKRVPLRPYPTPPDTPDKEQKTVTEPVVQEVEAAPSEKTSFVPPTKEQEIKPSPPAKEQKTAVVVKQEPALAPMEPRPWAPASSPECIQLDDEEDEGEREYRFLCRDCEGERGCPGTSCPHTSHPRLPLEFDLSAHITATGHVDIRPMEGAGLLELRPVGDLAPGLQQGIRCGGQETVEGHGLGW